MKDVGDKCDTCKDRSDAERLIRVNGALVRPRCDHVDAWPTVRRGTAKIERR